MDSKVRKYLGSFGHHLTPIFVFISFYYWFRQCILIITPSPNFPHLPSILPFLSTYLCIHSFSFPPPTLKTIKTTLCCSFTLDGCWRAVDLQRLLLLNKADCPLPEALNCQRLLSWDWDFMPTSPDHTGILLCGNPRVSQPL